MALIADLLRASLDMASMLVFSTARKPEIRAKAAIKTTVSMRVKPDFVFIYQL